MGSRMRMRQAVFGLGSVCLASILLFTCSCVPSGREAAALATNVENLTGAHTRVVWVQDAYALNDVFARGDQLRLMGYDSRDGRGERIILAGPANFARPMFTADGSVIVYSNHVDGHVYRVDWEGQNAAQLMPGRALAVWRDSMGGDWVYVGTEPAKGGAPAYHRVTRHQLSRGEKQEIVWQGQPVGEDNFQLSADGRIAGGNFPWPECGIMHIEEQRIEHLGRGCWTSLAPDNSYRFWIFDGRHRNLLLFDTVEGSRVTVPVSKAPGIDGHEAYHPRWSNHPRIMAMTGPYMIRSGGNNIRGGGSDVEVFIGRFCPAYQTMEKWLQVTSNEYANFFPDVWVDSGVATVDRSSRDADRQLNRAASASSWPSSQEGLVYLWEHAAAQNEVVLSEKGARRIYRPEARALARFGMHHTMWVDKGYFVDTAVPDLDKTFSLESTIHDREGDGILLAVGAVFSVAITNHRWVVRNAAREYDLGDAVDEAYSHIVLCVSPEQITRFQNGQRMHSVPLDEPISVSRQDLLYWGGHPEKGYGGLGRLSHLALYARSLSEEEIRHHAALLRMQQDARPPPVKKRVVGEVVVASAIPSPADIAPYRRALMFHEYEIVEGARAGDRLLAAHWAILDGHVLPDAERPVGSRHHLHLVLFDDRPELEGERVAMDHENFLLDWYYDLTLFR